MFPEVAPTSPILAKVFIPFGLEEDFECKVLIINGIDPKSPLSIT
jgi:hypothetical protein